MSTPLLPQSFWFRLALACPLVPEIPRATLKGKKPLLDLPETCRLPEPVRLEGRTPWAEVRVGWNAGGLGVQLEVRDKPGPITYDPVLPDASDGLQLWIDTRDTRDVHRATKFCHRFSVVVIPRDGQVLEPEIVWRPINRALADPPKVKVELVKMRAERIKGGYRLELFFPAEVLHGFDPETNRRLGFSYQVTDPARGDQFLTVGRDFPIAEDPSLWSTLELTGDPS